jgi:hypothetical protein
MSIYRLNTLMTSVCHFMKKRKEKKGKSPSKTYVLIFDFFFLHVRTREEDEKFDLVILTSRDIIHNRLSYHKDKTYVLIEHVTLQSSHSKFPIYAVMRPWAWTNIGPTLFTIIWELMGANAPF